MSPTARNNANVIKHRYVKLPQIDAVGLRAVQGEIAARELDALVFNDIGLSQHTWFLAFGRFAPVQCLTLSNGMTSGLPDTVDYYVSSRAEQPGVEAQGKYSEALVLLEALYFHLDDPLTVPIPIIPIPISPTPPPPGIKTVSTATATTTASTSSEETREYFQRMQQFEFAQLTKAALRRKWGLPPNSNLYMCFQGLFKVHPMFDEAIFDVLLRDPHVSQFY